MKTCEWCGAEFSPNNTKQRYCDRACGSKATANKRGRRVLPDIACEGCGEVFRPTDAKTRFHSRECYLTNGTTRRYKDANGYIRCWVPPGTPNRSKNGRMAEHRYVMQEHLGRPLTSSESVHHINGDKTDNRIENLQLRQGKHGKGEALCCLDCGSQNVGHVPLS